MNRRIRSSLILLVFVIVLSGCAGRSDSISINFRKLPETPCYVTLLSKKADVHGHHALTSPEFAVDIPEGMEDVWDKFLNYRDTEGYYFLQFVKETYIDFKWANSGLYDFKILIYLPESDRFLVSKENIQRKADIAVYRIDVSGADENGLFSVYDTVSAGTIFTSVIKSFGMIFVVELFLALVFGMRNKRHLRTILLACVAEQIVLIVFGLICDMQITHMFYNMYRSPMSFIGLILCISVTKAILYRQTFFKDGNGKSLAALYGFCSFILASVVGSLAASFFPYLF